jgi:hypothetical protein
VASPIEWLLMTTWLVGLAAVLYLVWMATTQRAGWGSAVGTWILLLVPVLGPAVAVVVALRVREQARHRRR